MKNSKIPLPHHLQLIVAVIYPQHSVIALLGMVEIIQHGDILVQILRDNFILILLGLGVEQPHCMGHRLREE
jgi:hypothetical protein